LTRFDRSVSLCISLAQELEALPKKVLQIQLPNMFTFIYLYLHTIAYLVYIISTRRTPRPCTVCGARRLSRRGDRRLVGAHYGRWREDTFGRARCVTLRYCLPSSVWVDPLTEHIFSIILHRSSRPCPRILCRSRANPNIRHPSGEP